MHANLFFFIQHLLPAPPPASHRQELGYEEPVSHPENIHHFAERVRRGLTALCTLFSLSLSILQRSTHCRKGHMGGQGRYRGRRCQRGGWRRWCWSGTGRGRGAVPLRGQGGRWLQHVVQMFQWVSQLMEEGRTGSRQVCVVNLREPRFVLRSVCLRWVAFWGGGELTSGNATPDKRKANNYL